LCKRCNIIVRSRIILSLKKRFRHLGIISSREPIRRYLARLRSR
jgi:hypothetical protein